MGATGSSGAGCIGGQLGGQLGGKGDGAQLTGGSRGGGWAGLMGRGPVLGWVGAVGQGGGWAGTVLFGGHSFGRGGEGGAGPSEGCLRVTGRDS